MYYLGIDLGGTNIAIGLVDEQGQIIHRGNAPTGRERGASVILKEMGMLALKVMEEAGVRLEQINGVGVGSPGAPDVQKGVIIYNNNLGFRNVPVRAELQKYLPLPVYVDNDANCAALAEGLLGAAGGVRHSVTVTLGTGIGGGVIIDHNIYSGFNNAGSELGHMVIVAGGKPCTCGRRGCWEAYASARGLIESAQAAAEENPTSLLFKMVKGDLTKLTAKTPFDAAQAGDRVAAAVVNEFLDYLAVGIGNIINIFQPEVIVLGGGVSKQGDDILRPLEDKLTREVYGEEGVPVAKLKLAVLGNDAGIVGAALLGFPPEKRALVSLFGPDPD
ncbi:MAG TPA: ROK family protein [Firmicutes bacterium]|jgi:glucokinase|nr:ROK family protein [Bacillota bacterium]